MNKLKNGTFGLYVYGVNKSLNVSNLISVTFNSSPVAKVCCSSFNYGSKLLMFERLAITWLQ